MIPISVLREYMPKLKDEDLKELGPVEYDQSKVPEVSKKHAENVRRKVYLPDMTESFARGVEYAGLMSSGAENKATNADLLSKDTQNRFDNQIANSQYDNEVVDMRLPKNATVPFASARERLNYADDNLNSRAINVLNPPIGMNAAKGDGITDDTAAIQAIIDTLGPYDEIVIPTRSYLVNGLLFDINNLKINMSGRFVPPINSAGEVVTIRADDVNIKGVLKVERGDNRLEIESVGVLLHNANRVSGFIDSSRNGIGVKIYADSGKGACYNELHLLNIWSNRKGVLLDSVSDDPLEGWVNENNLYGGRFGWSNTIGYLNPGESRIDAANRTGFVHFEEARAHMNDNVLFSPSFEGTGGTFVKTKGRYNTIITPRFEGESVFYDWQEGSVYNQILYPYHHDEINDTNAINSGSRNKIHARNFTNLGEHHLELSSIKIADDPRRSTHFTSGDGLIDIQSTYSSEDKLILLRDSSGSEVLSIDGLGNVSAVGKKYWRTITPATTLKTHSQLWKPQVKLNIGNLVTMRGELEVVTALEHGAYLFTLSPGLFSSEQEYKVSTTARTGAVGSIKPILLKISTSGVVTLDYSTLSGGEVIQLSGITYSI